MANAKDTQSIFTALCESRKTREQKSRKLKAESRTPVVESADVKMFTGSLLRESVENDVAEDVLDNIVVVTDPDKTVDDLEVRADNIQDAIDSTPEGEAAFSDEYIGDKVYACPICGESFFADEEYNEGDICPICKAEPQDGFLMQGVVAPCEECEADTEDMKTAPAEEEPSDSEVANDDAEDVIEKEESVSHSTVSRKIECDAPESEIEVTIDLDDNKVEIEKEPAELETELDEESFEEALNQFADENYNSTVDKISVSNASYNPETDELCMDCVAECKNGDRVPLQFRMKESRVRGNKAILVAKECKNVFKVESKTPAFKFQVVNNNGTICCESLKYSFTTTHSRAGKVKVEGYCKSGKRKVR